VARFRPEHQSLLYTGLPPVSDRIRLGQNAIFGDVAKLADSTRAHQALLVVVVASQLIGMQQ